MQKTCVRGRSGYVQIYHSGFGMPIQNEFNGRNRSRVHISSLATLGSASYGRIRTLLLYTPLPSLLAFYATWCRCRVKLQHIRQPRPDAGLVSSHFQYERNSISSQFNRQLDRSHHSARMSGNNWTESGHLYAHNFTLLDLQMTPDFKIIHRLAFLTDSPGTRHC